MITQINRIGMKTLHDSLAHVYRIVVPDSLYH